MTDSNGRLILAFDDATRSATATITTALVEALAGAIDAAEPTTVLVHGEEDLATLPALLGARRCDRRLRPAGRGDGPRPG